MSTDATDSLPDRSAEQITSTYLEDGRVVIYDETNEAAWIQSDTILELPDE